MGAKLHKSPGYKKQGLSRANSCTAYYMIPPPPTPEKCNQQPDVIFPFKDTSILSPLSFLFLSKTVCLLHSPIPTVVLKLYLKSSAFISDLKSAQMCFSFFQTRKGIGVYIQPKTIIESPRLILLTIC